MCCSREHYPEETGVWVTDSFAEHHHEGFRPRARGICGGKYDHLHIVMPRFTHGVQTVCISADEWSLYARCSNYNDESDTHLASFVLNSSAARMAQEFFALRERIALVVTEGGRLDKALFQRIIYEYIVENPESPIAKLTPEGSPGGLAPIADPPEFHEWLLMQAEHELKRKGAPV